LSQHSADQPRLGGGCRDESHAPTSWRGADTEREFLEWTDAGRLEEHWGADEGGAWCGLQGDRVYKVKWSG
jgi:hypothetical protein